VAAFSVVPGRHGHPRRPLVELSRVRTPAESACSHEIRDSHIKSTMELKKKGGNYIRGVDWYVRVNFLLDSHRDSC